MQQKMESNRAHIREQSRGWGGRWAPEDSTDRIHGLAQHIKAAS